MRKVFGKRKIFVLLLAAIACSAAALVGCGNTPDGGGSGGSGGIEETRIYYSVTFDSRGGSAVDSQRVMEGNPVRRPELPVRENYDFTGWYKDKAATDNLWNFDTDRVNSDLTLYAGWEAMTEKPDEPLPDKPEQPEATDSLVYEREGDAYVVKGVGEETAVVIPAEHEGLPVTAIRGDYGNGAFARKDIVSIVIPDTVEEIGQNTFNNCKNLASVRIGENSELAKIGNNAFSGCSLLKGIYLPAGVTEIGGGAFNNCGGLEQITVASENTTYRSENGHLIENATDTLIRGGYNAAIPNGVKIIAQAAFRRSAITQIDIPASVVEIGNNAFDDCANLTAVTVDNESENYAAQDGILYNKAKTELVKVPEGAVGSVTLPSTLSELPMYAFDGIAELREVNIPRGALSGGIRFAAFRSSGVAKVNYGGTESEWQAIISQSHDRWNVGALAAFAVICADTQTPPTETANVLVAYFSCTGTTKGIADKIASSTGGTPYEIAPAEPYTSADLNYNTDCRANREQNDPTCRPEITGNVENMDNYDIVFVGYPIWWGQAPKIIYTFLESYDFSDKTIIPFCTSGSSGVGSSATNLHASAPTATWMSGQRFSGGASQSSIDSYVQGLGFARG